MINTRKLSRDKMQERKAAAEAKTFDRIKRWGGGISDPSPSTVTAYVHALDALVDEFESMFGDLGTGLSSPRGLLENEREQALKLLVKLRIRKAKPSTL